MPQNFQIEVQTERTIQICWNNVLEWKRSWDYATNHTDVKKLYNYMKKMGVCWGGGGGDPEPHMYSLWRVCTAL